MEVSREEAKRILRRLELEAYSSIVSTFRAQGDLNREKKKLLTDLGIHLSISTERHRAEVRRAFSDDRLGAVAECIVGPTTCSEWAAEGRRLVPLMPRLVPQTVLSGTATASANAAAASNAQIVHTKKVTNISQTSTKETNSTSFKQSPAKPLARPSSDNVDVEYDSDDNKAKKKRRLSQSITSPKPVQKISLNASVIGAKAAAKTASVSTSTMTKVGKPATSTGPIKTTQKLMLPASASQVKLLTKTVSITQTVNQAKTMLNYKTVTATNPAAVKVQTVMSHPTPKTQVKLTVPVAAKNVLIPKASPIKAAAGPIKTGITMSQLAMAKQRGKQAPRFKPMPGAVKFKSVTALAMGLPSAPVTMATATTNISSLTGTITKTVPSTQPIVRVIQVPGAASSSITSKTLPTVATGLPKVTALPISTGSTITKIPLSTTHSTVTTSTTQASRLTTTNSTLPTSAKTVVMTTIVGGTKKVVLSVPAPISPILSKPIVNVTKATKISGLVSQAVKSLGDNTTKQGGTTTTKMVVPSLECTEPSSVLQAPTPTQAPIVHKQNTTQVSCSQVRTRPLQTLLPAPPKPLIAAPTTSLTSSSSVRKLPQILPAPAKTTVLVPLTTPVTPLSTPVTQAVCATAVSSVTTTVHPKVPLMQIIAKSMQPSATKFTMSKTVPVTSAKASSAPATVQQAVQQSVIVSQAIPTAIKGSGTKPETKLSTASESSVPFSELAVNDKNMNSGSKCEESAIEKQPSEGNDNKTEGDSNTSSEDDSLLVCSETIDCPSIQEEASACPGDVLVVSTPLKSLDHSGVGKDEVVSAAKEDKNTSVAENSNSSQNRKVIVEMLDSFESPSLIKGETNSVFNKKDENEGDKLKDCENNTNLHDNKDIDKVVGRENFDAVSSFLETFAGKNINNSRKDLTEEDADILSVDMSNVFDEENKNIIGQNKNRSSLHQRGNEVHRTILDNASESNSLLSAFDILDTPMTYANETGELQISISHTDGLDSKPVPPQDHTHSLSKESSTEKNTHGCIGVKSLKSFAESSIEQSLQNSTRDHEIQSDLSDNSTDSCNAYPTKLSLGNNEIAASCSDGHELTESEKLALEAIANVRTSSRKRKPPTVLTVSPPRQSSGWVRGALSLLQKVCSYRGQGRKKGDYSAASWFLRPVDPNEAPGYFKVIRNPMDLSSIKTKLETGIYQDYIEFHEDMVLIKNNCFKYNPPGHGIRKDCEEVFNYFDVEYEKMLERWEKVPETIILSLSKIMAFGTQGMLTLECHVSPAKKPRTMPKPELTSSTSC